MASKPKNYPKLKGIEKPILTPEENEENIKKIQEILALIGIYYLKSKGY